eukprot:gb/GFBE01066010.1/.p1 GENE.gb/GFBE01066010.1/~~gb/GFBE01066010.1/.p1  ORF type:complete len:411 (+),score=104.09 gb/GFBE01066010.1/:1-1233(+)
MSGGKSFQKPPWCCAPRDPQLRRRLVDCFADKEAQDGRATPFTVEILDKAVYTIGRGPSADIQLRGDMASRLHAAVLQNAAGQKFLVDLKSANGTFLGGKKLPPHEPVEWKDGQSAHFGTGDKADIFVLRGQGGETAAEEPEAKRPRLSEDTAKTGPADDPLAALYGDLPDATVEAAPKKDVTHKLQPLPPPVEDPSKILFLDVDGVLRPLHSRQDAFQNTKTIEINGRLVPLLGNSEAMAGVDFWPTAMRALRFIVQKTGARIVLSSDWRKDEMLKKGVCNSLEEYSIPPLYSQTPDMDSAAPGVIKTLHSSFREKRCKEIRKWLSKNPKVRYWCAIDDIDLSIPDKEAQRSRQNGAGVFLDMQENFVKTNPQHGLNMEVARLAICYLNGAPPTEEIFAAAYGIRPPED